MSHAASPQSAPANKSSSSGQSLHPPIVATPTSIRLQPKLTINTPGDKYEQEADRVAEQVMRMPAPSRKRRDESGGDDHQAGHPGLPNRTQPVSGTIQRLATSTTAGPVAPPIVRDVVNSAGSPLPSATRSFMEPRFGRDFSNVRIHTDARAAESSAAVNARAYTLGNNIVFGSGELSRGGNQLLAHELTHVVQQQDGAPSMIQRAPIDSLGFAGDLVVDAAVAMNPLIPRPLQGAASGAIRGVITEAKQQFRENEGAASEKINELKKKDNILAMIGGFVGGLAAGIISPITALWDSFVFIDKIAGIGWDKLKNLGDTFQGFVSEAIEIAQTFRPAVSQAMASAKEMLKKPLDFVASLFEGDVASRFETAANQAGHEAVRSIVETIRAQFADPQKDAANTSLVTNFDSSKQPAEPGQEKPSSTDSPMGLVDADKKISEFKDSVFSGAWSKIGYNIGNKVGFVAINVVLMVFSAGIGSALTRFGAFLGELGGALGNVGKLVSILAKGVVFAEKILEGITKIAMKPLQPILRAIEPLLQRFQGFLKRFLGVAEQKEKAMAGDLADALKKKPHAPKAHAPNSHHEAPTKNPVGKTKERVSDRGGQGTGDLAGNPKAVPNHPNAVPDAPQPHGPQTESHHQVPSTRLDGKPKLQGIKGGGLGTGKATGNLKAVPDHPESVPHAQHKAAQSHLAEDLEHAQPIEFKQAAGGEHFGAPSIVASGEKNSPKVTVKPGSSTSKGTASSTSHHAPGRASSSTSRNIPKTAPIVDKAKTQSHTTNTSAKGDVKGVSPSHVPKGTNSVYRSVDAAGNVQYVGITNNLARRAAEHLRTKGIQIEKLLGGLSRSDAKAIEQALIEIHELGKNGGTLLNKINSIAASNPNYADQLRRGLELLTSIGY